MRTKIQIFLAVVLFSGLTACADDRGARFSAQEQTVEEGPVGPIDNPTPKVEKFNYDKLMYKEEGLCSSANFNFQYLSVQDVPLGKAYDGKDMLASMKIQLYRNHTFEIEYEEHDIESYRNEGYTYNRKRIRNLSGYWKIEGTRMILGDVLTLEGRMEDKYTLASVLFLKDIVSRNLAGKVGNGRKVWSTSGIKSYREVCPTTESDAGVFSNLIARDNLESINLNSLQMERSDAFMSGSNKIVGVEFFLQKDGSYNLLFRVIDVAEAYPVEKVYLVDSGVWDREGQALKTYSGRLAINASTGAVSMRLSKDLVFYRGKEDITFATRGKTILLTLKSSDFDMDDLTSTYAGGDTHLYK